jgi:hypothetical protein
MTITYRQHTANGTPAMSPIGQWPAHRFASKTNPSFKIAVPKVDEPSGPGA